MRLNSVIALALLWTVVAFAVPAAPAAGSMPRGRPVAAQTAPPQFLPWPPPLPAMSPREGEPLPSGTPPFLPSGDPLDVFDVQSRTTLEVTLATIGAAAGRLWRWLDSLRQAAAGAIVQIVVPLPYDVPSAASPLDVIAQLASLPGRWRAVAAAALAKLAPQSWDAAAARHAADIAESPELSHEAATIASADQQVIANAIQQEIALATTAALASATVEDRSVGDTAGAAEALGDQLIAGAQDLPSSRAGIELLVAGTGAALRTQTSLTKAIALRIAGLIEQGAQLSGQLAAIASTLGVMTARDLERDRVAVDARLGVADAARGAGVLLRRLLAGAGEPADEIRLAPLY